MKSYWFVYFVLYCRDKKEQLVEVRGNSVHELESESFLPHTVQNVIKKYLLEIMGHELSASDHRAKLFIESFGKIDQGGYEDFSGERTETCRFSFSAREFIHEKEEIRFRAGVILGELR